MRSRGHSDCYQLCGSNDNEEVFKVIRKIECNEALNVQLAKAADEIKNTGENLHCF